MAEDVVLPINQRSGQVAFVPEVILIRDVEAQNSSMSTMIVERPQKQQKHFPIFIILISIFQVRKKCLKKVFEIIFLIRRLGYTYVQMQQR